MMGLVQTAMHVEEIFSIFEPCHSGDRYRGAPLDPKDLTQSFDMFKEIRRCDFNRVNDLWGWNHPLSLHTGFADYSQHGASEACKAAELRVFKTTQFADLKKYVIPGLENDHNLRVIHIQRDPRGILASRLKARGFKNTTEEYMENVCNVMVANKAVRHKNMLKVRFEKWMNAPEEESRKVFKFLNYEFGDVTKDWILEHFDAPSCPDEEKDEFGLCRTDSAIVTAKWKKELSPEWLTFFETGPCKLALHWYGYPHVKPPYTEAPAEEGEEEPAAE